MTVTTVTFCMLIKYARGMFPLSLGAYRMVLGFATLMWITQVRLTGT